MSGQPPFLGQWYLILMVTGQPGRCALDGSWNPVPLCHCWDRVSTGPIVANEMEKKVVGAGTSGQDFSSLIERREQ